MHLREVFWGSEPYIEFKPGNYIFKQGAPGDYMYILMDGQVEVRIGDRQIGVFEGVEVFGEMALIDSQPRSASVIALTPCKVIRVNQDQFKIYIRRSPEFGIDVMRTLVERIRWMNSMVLKRAATNTTPDPQPVQQSS